MYTINHMFRHYGWNNDEVSRLVDQPLHQLKMASVEMMWPQNELLDSHDGSGYMHGCRNSSETKRLFSRQPFPMPKGLYTRLLCIHYKSVIYTAAVSHAKRFIYTAAVHSL